MSNFGDALFNLLPVHSSLQDTNNPGRKVLDNTVGEWFDHHDILTFYDNLFLNTCTGKYLDLFGKDYGVTRRLDESDEDYRTRIIQEKNDNLTPAYLKSVYGLTLYHAVGGFSTADNTLTSDNPYSTNYYMAVLDSNIKKILDNKFIMDNIIVWYDGTPLDYIINTSNENILKDNLEIYNNTVLNNYFQLNTTLKKVRLKLPNATNLHRFLIGCTSLTDVYLDVPNGIWVGDLLSGCTALENLEVNIPNGNTSTPVQLLPVSSSALKSVIFTVKDSYKATYIEKLSDVTKYPNIEYLCVNGEEVDLS